MATSDRKVPKGLTYVDEAMTAVSPEPIAIVGMAMRLPGGIHTPNELWDFLIKGGDARGPIPPNRYNVGAFYSKSGRPGTVKMKHGYFLSDEDGLEHIDASFFSMSKAEVEKLDPQQRMLLEVVQECMDNSGQQNWRGDSIGVYVGTFGEDFQDIGAKDTMHAGLYRVAGSGDWALSQRVSYEFNLKGPSITVQSACSSSMIGVHQAVQAMRSGECTSAIVAGTNLVITPTMSIAMTEQGVLSPEGSCKTFDVAADGYARGEAINAVYLKPLSAALRDHDPIRAVIRGSATNCDGKTPGFSMPSAESHEAMIRRAYSEAQLNPHETAYVECHGTGTSVGDPLETTAIARCFGEQTHPVYIGSIKPNLGHAEGASGISSLMKVTLALENGLIPPNIKFNNPNPNIPWSAGLKVPMTPTSWPTEKTRASVNSFGIGGANAHVIVESANSYGIVSSRLPPTIHNLTKDMVSVTIKDNAVLNGQMTPPEETLQSHLVLATAHNADTLDKTTDLYMQYALAHPQLLPELAYTLGAHRQHHNSRTFALARQNQPLSFAKTVKAGMKKQPELNFVFTGQGAQWAGMARELIIDHPAVASDIWAMNETLQSLPNAPLWSIRDELMKSASESRIMEAEFSQPLCTAIQVAMVNLLRGWGIRPSAVVGHSSGEIAAAYAAESVTMEQAIIIAFYRGQGTKGATRKGGMAAVGLGRAEVFDFLLPGVVVACENSSRSVTLSGDEEVLDEVLANLFSKRKEVFQRKLTVEMAYHSHHMSIFGAPYEKTLGQYLTAKAPSVPFYSSVTGRAIVTSALGPAYWRKNLESPVLFHAAVCSMLKTKAGPQVFLEIGPKAGLAGPVKQILKDEGRTECIYFSAQNDKIPSASDALLSCIGLMWSQGFEFDLKKVFERKTILQDLPLYQWNHNALYWYESRVSRDWRLRKFPRHEILGSRTLEGNDLHPEWRNVFKLEDIPWVRDHKVIDDIVFPFAGYVAMAGEAIRQVAGADTYTLRNITVQTAMVLSESDTYEIMTSLRPVRLTTKVDSDWWEFDISSLKNGIWMKHASGQVKSGSVSAHQKPKIEIFPRAVKKPYPAMAIVGLNYGPKFQGLRDVTSLPQAMTASATLAPPEESESVYAVHPTTIDHCLQLLLTAHSDGLARRITQLFVPTSIDELYIGQSLVPNDMRAVGVAQSVSTGIAGELTAVSGDQIMLALRGGKFVPINNEVDAADPDPVAGARLTFKADLDFVPVHELIKPSSSTKLNLEKLEKFTLLAILDIKSKIMSYQPTKEYLGQFQSWIVYQVALASHGLYDLVPDAKELCTLTANGRSVFLDQLRQELSTTPSASAAGLIDRVLDDCIEIVSEKKDGIEVLMEGLTPFYNYLECRTNARRWFELLGHQNPQLRVLEIGAGTGGTTEVVLKGLVDAAGDSLERMYASYTYTDVSAGFFPAAKERFACHGAIEYKTLDVSSDPLAQGFDEHSYDLIVAANVLHATPSLQQTLQNVRKLLAPKGRLFLQELSPQAKAVNLIMGVLPGWWLGEADGRANEPYVSPERWDKELKAAGFGGVEAALYDDAKPYHLNANIIARPAEVVKKVEVVTQKRATILVADANSSAIKSFQEALAQLSIATDVCTLDDEPKKGQDVISLLELDQPFFCNLTADIFAQFQSFVAKLGPSGLLWLTRSEADPKFGMSLGLARTLRYELSLSFATVQLEKTDEQSYEAAASIFGKFISRDTSGSVDPEYEWNIDASGNISIGRYQTVDVKEEMDDEEEVGELRLEISKVGLLQTLRWAPYTLPDCGDNDVIVRTMAAGLNDRDHMVSHGEVAGTLGFEAAGVIKSVGKEVKNVAIGDRVMMLGNDVFSTLSTISASRVVKIPSSLAFEDAASLPLAFATAIQSLINVGQLEKDQSVLVHNASEGVGLAAIQLCKLIGATVFATVDSDEKAAHLFEKFDIPVTSIFRSTDASFQKSIHNATGSHGVDIVLNSLTGELLHASWECVAEDGKMIELGKKDFIGKGNLRMDLFEANRSFIGVDVARLRGERVQKLLQTIVDMFEAGKITPLKPVTTFVSDDVEDAFRALTKADTIGKIVVQLPEIEAEADLNGEKGINSFAFKADKSYLLIGGLGGLGRAIATYMVEHGARHLIFLSPSAGKKPTDEHFAHELASQGCTTQMIAGDVSKLEDVKNIAATAAKPIAGVLQLSMVLRDGSFLTMTYDNWLAAITPKLQGTYNLHDCLGDKLDFFIATSSISGSFGNAGQANYAAANSFLDSFVSWRHSLGLHAAVLDVGVVGDVGYVAQNAAIQESLRAAGAYVLKEQAVLDALRWAILCGRPESVTGGQVAIGIRTTKPLADETCRVNWKRDLRMAAYRNVASGNDSSIMDSSSPGTNALATVIPRLPTNPSLLDNPEIQAGIKEEIGFKILSLMSDEKPTEVDLTQSLTSLGIDSLVTIELKNWIRRATSGTDGLTGVETSTLEIMGNGSLAAVGDIVISRLRDQLSK